MNSLTTQKHKCFVSVVVYLMNDAKTIRYLLDMFDEFFSERFDAYEFVLVNDASDDDTVQQIERMRNSLQGNINIVNMAWRHGSELAILAGKDAAIGDFVFEIESANIDWPIEIISDLYDKCLSGWDIVSASPIGGSKLTSKLFYYLFKRVSSLKMDLSTETVRIVSRRALNAVLTSKEKIRYRKLLYRLTGFPHTTILYKPTQNGKQKKMGLRDSLSLAFNIFNSYSNLWLHIGLFFSFVFLSISVIGGLYTVFMYFYLDQIMEGWTTTMLFLSAGFSGLFFLFAITSKSITHVIAEVQDKPLYRVSYIKKL